MNLFRDIPEEPVEVDEVRTSRNNPLRKTGAFCTDFKKDQPSKEH